ncbi:hypothetical protein DVH24_004263 [Malus domestica]|uniref:Uncharacterized protein n=1 Tax=Malus domestica TaxID=3750 RepID=A0A498K7X6_MALDO|nr:hypothetical protein DVH24_004263 [Malus domestica]
MRKSPAYPREEFRSGGEDACKVINKKLKEEDDVWDEGARIVEHKLGCLMGTLRNPLDLSLETLTDRPNQKTVIILGMRCHCHSLISYSMSLRAGHSSIQYAKL